MRGWVKEEDINKESNVEYKITSAYSLRAGSCTQKAIQCIRSEKECIPAVVRGHVAGVEKCNTFPMHMHKL